MTRYYGGTKLGVGGLVRAYGAAAAAVLDAAVLEPRVERCTLRLAYGYADAGAVERVLERWSLTSEASFAAGVERTVDVPTREVEAVLEALRDATAGRIVARPPA